MFRPLYVFLRLFLMQGGFIVFIVLTFFYDAALNGFVLDYVAFSMDIILG